ncbi:phosphatidylinositolglycan-related [Euphorbia peplus]|nr:phosphatidylinositolglycan-related [Euphorbia peplus]
MVDFSIADRRYTYIREFNAQPVDVHRILVRKSKASGFLLCFAAFTLLANASCLFLVKDLSISILLWSLLFSVIVIKSVFWKPVVKESVIIMPAFGVQLETHYRSGRVVRRFVPIDKILKPVLVECVTSVTCYWSLSFILREETDLMLVFKELRPPVKMLAPIWKALCVASGIEESSGTSAKDGTYNI